MLLLGMVSYPSINFGDKTESDLKISSNYLISAFAEEDDETEDNDDKKNDNKETNGDNLEDANNAITDAEQEVNRA